AGAGRGGCSSWLPAAADFAGDHRAGIRLVQIAFHVLHPLIVEHDDERRAVGRERRLHLVHAVARDADRLAGEVADRAAGRRADGRTDGTADEPDDGADGGADARVRLALIADADLALHIHRHDRVRLDALAGGVLVLLHHLEHLAGAVLARVDGVDEGFLLPGGRAHDAGARGAHG